MHKRISILAAAVVAALVAVAVAMAMASGGSGHRVHVVKTVKNATLGTTILVNLKGRTLYSLSAEKKGKFICDNRACLSLWHPLVVGAGVTPTGTSHLGTVKRPDGHRQVTYRGGPLYTFTGDHARGDAKGDGFKDVGVWHFVSVGKAPAPAPTTTSGGSGGGGYGGYGY
jgi:predicted lipoprotein with Yx(FWY)xxD motif